MIFSNVNCILKFIFLDHPVAAKVEAEVHLEVDRGLAVAHANLAQDQDHAKVAPDQDHAKVQRVAAIQVRHEKFMKVFLSF